MVAPTSADDLHLRIRIPNPIPKIVKGVKRVGIRVGNIAVRVAERIDGDDEREVVRSYPAPLSPPEAGTVQIESTQPQLAPISIDDKHSRLLPPSENPAEPPPNSPLPRPLKPPNGPTVAPIPNVPIEARPSADSAVQKIHEAAYPPLPPSTAAPSPATVSAPGVPEHSPATKPTPPPEHPYGKAVPGRPGLVYPPGMKEIPENMIDVRGITPGTKVRDPVTKMIFRVP